MTNTAQRSFSGGEVSPSLYARTDTARYAAGLRTCRNFICLKHGGAANRPGTELVGLCPSGLSRLVPFVFNDAQAYALELSNGSIRVIQAGAYLGMPYVITSYDELEVFQLQFTQSADVLTITHPTHVVMALKRLAALTWTWTPVVFGPGIDPPTGLFMSQGGGGTEKFWVVTALSESTDAESYPSAAVGTDMSTLAIPTRDLFWDPVPGASGYNIYESEATGGYGFIGTTTTTSFRAGALTPDFLDQPPVPRPLFAAPDDYPSAVGQYQQRRWLAGTNSAPETVWSSRTADLDNFCVSKPVQDDDAVTFTMISRKVSAIRHIVDSTALFLFTSGGEAVVRGDASGTIRPTDINLLTFSRHGCALKVAPIVTEDAIVFLQARQSVIREIIEGEVREKYVGRDLTIYATHLFQGYTIVDWAYQEVPNSTIWAVRNDGVLLGLTYMNDQQVLAWHRHDTDGLVESVCCVPEGGEDRLYLVVNRGGQRMVERMASRNFTDVVDAIFMDSTLSYDGRNTTTETMTLSGGSTWDYDALLTITRSAGGFALLEEGNEIHFTAADGQALRVRLANYVSPTEMTGYPNRVVPTDLRNVATATWSRAVDTFSGLNHLEGKSVAITGDGYVVASPNNPAYAAIPIVVTGGSVSLPKCYAVLHVGLPYTSDLETLDIDTPQGASLKDSKMKVNDVTAYVEASRGFFAGQSLPTGSDPLLNMDEAKFRDVSADFGLIELQTDTIGVKIPAAWNSNGRVAIRNPDPIPLTVLALVPRGHLSQTG